MTATSAMTIDEIHAAIRALPPRERLQLVERIVHDIVETMADEHDLVRAVGTHVVAARQQKGKPR